MPANRTPKVSATALNGYLDTIESSRTQSRRYFSIILLLAAAVLVLAVGLAATAPLKEKVPYFVEVESATGRVDVSTRTAQEFVPTEASVRYFIGRWVVDTFTIDEATRSQRLPSSWSFMRGPARDQWNRIILEGERPTERLAERPDFRRSVEFVAPPQIVANGAVIVRIDLVEGRTVVGRKQISLRYALLPPETDEDILRNPIGLWITDFGVVDERL